MVSIGNHKTFVQANGVYHAYMYWKMRASILGAEWRALTVRHSQIDKHRGIYKTIRHSAYTVIRCTVHIQTNNNSRRISSAYEMVKTKKKVIKKKKRMNH